MVRDGQRTLPSASQVHAMITEKQSTVMRYHTWGAHSRLPNQYWVPSNWLI